MPQTKKLDFSYGPKAEYRYWLYDPAGDGMTYYRTKEDRDEAASNAINAYLDDGWDEDVENVSAGEVTHSAQALDKEFRPDKLDEQGYDDEGTYWGEHEWRGNFKLEPIAPNT